MHTIQTSQTPMVRPWKYDHFNIDNYPLGTNAIVVIVISQYEYDILVITRVRGEAEDEC